MLYWNLILPSLSVTFYAVVFLAPALIVDVVLVVAGGRNRHFEEVRIDQHRGG